MKLSYIEQIIEISKTGSLTQASNNLFMSQPNLSLSVKNAEKELGILLFNRTSTGMELTREGQEFVERASEILAQVNALEQLCKSKRIIPPETLRVASIGYRILDIEFSRLLQKYSDTNIYLDSFTCVGTKLLDVVANDSAELGFCSIYTFSKNILMKQIELRKLEYTKLAVPIAGIFVGRNNPLFSDQDKFVDFDKLHNLPMVMIAKREFNAQNITNYLQFEKKINFDCVNNVTVSDFSAVRNLISVSNAFAVASKLEGDYGEDGYYKNVRFIPFEEGILDAEFGYIQKKNATLSTLAQELIEGLKSRFE